MLIGLVSAISDYPGDNPLDAQLVWNFDNDASEEIQGLTGTNNGCDYSTVSKTGTHSLNCTSGNTDYFDTNFNNLTLREEYSICYWLTIWEPNANNNQFQWGSLTSGSTYFGVYETNVNQWTYISRDSGTIASEIETDAGYTNQNEWSLWCVVHTLGTGADNMSIYINATKEPTTANVNQGYGDDSLTYDIYLATRNNAGSPQLYLSASYDQFMIFKYALDVGDMQTLYEGNYTLEATTEIDLFFRNETDLTLKNAFDQDEEFKGYVNYSIDGIGINETNGDCVLVIEGINRSMSYNSSSSYWDLDAAYSYSDFGTKDITADCNFPLNEDYEKSITENVTIYNKPPVLSIDTIVNSLTYDNLTNGSVYQYSSSNWNFSTTISDDDLSYYTIAIYNRTDRLEYKEAVDFISLSSINFTNFLLGNPYRLEVWANDSYNNISETSLNFYVNDTINPQSTGFEHTIVTNGSLYTWDAYVTDEYVWNLSVECSNGFDYGVSEIGQSSFYFSNSTFIQYNTTCFVDYCDGHTDIKLPKDMSIAKIGDNRLIFDEYEVEFNNIQTLDFTIKPNKVEFCVEMEEDADYIEINLSNECKKAVGSTYAGHYICGKYAIDFENKNKFNVVTLGNTIMVDSSKKKTTKLCFNSIVALNCVHKQQDINLSQPINELGLYNNDLIDGTSWFSTGAMNTQTTAGVLMWFFTFIIIVAMIVLSEYLKIPVMAILTSILMMFYGFLIYAKVSALIGIIFIIISFGYLLRGIYMVNE